MRKFDIEEIISGPEHSQNANTFMEFIENQLSNKFYDLRISVINCTVEELELFPQVIEETEAEGDIALSEELRRMDQEADIASIKNTEISAFIEGDEDARIEVATAEMNKKAEELHGKISIDTEIGDNPITEISSEALKKQLGLESLHLRQRYLTYEFK